MSQLTNYAENKLADFVRGQGLSLPTGWKIGLASAADDSSFTELSGTGYARVNVNRTLANFAGTQGDATTLASTGASHKTSNNGIIDFGTSGAAWGTARYVLFLDASSGGNCWFWLPLTDEFVIGSGTPVSLAAASVILTLGLTGGMSDFLSNKVIDFLFRGQSYSWPASLYAKLMTAAPSNSGGGTEVSGGGYARVGIASTLTAWSGTQSAGSTSASSGSAGRISNNSSLTYPIPTGSWGTVTHEGLQDDPTAGNLMFWGALPAPKTIGAGGAAPSHVANSLGITFA